MFTKENLITVLNDIKGMLTKTESMFFSEANLQLVFAMQILKRFDSKFECIPEYPIYLGDDKFEIDLLIKDLETNEHTIIEFKYKTVNSHSKAYEGIRIPTTVGQSFIPKSHMAHALGCYDVLNDLVRTRKIINDESINVVNGFMIFLTNDHVYWDKPSSTITYKYGTDFNLENGRTLEPNQVLSWNLPIGKTSIVRSVGSNRLTPIKIDCHYDIIWHDLYGIYKYCQNPKINEFKVLVIEA